MKQERTSKSRVKTRSTTLTPLEEKVLRMRRGLRAPDDLALEQVGQDDPVVAEQLRAIEERALLAVAARKSSTKREIVKTLKRKPSK